MNSNFLLLAGLCVSGPLAAQAPGKFPPDSLINVKVIPKNTPVMQVVGMMRNFAGGLGVRCPFCHVGQEGQPLAQFARHVVVRMQHVIELGNSHRVDHGRRRLDDGYSQRHRLLAASRYGRIDAET